MVINCLKIYDQHFIHNLDLEVAQQLFEQSVCQIEMAISSFCNRRCKYCPNHRVDRISEKHYMEDTLFFNIINQLKNISYSNTITVHRYNEPLADVPNTLLRLSSLRSFLPKAIIRVVTNGDYLDKELLLSLASIGVDVIVATVHADNPSNIFEIQVSELKNRVESLAMPFHYKYLENEKSYQAYIQCGKLNMVYQTVDFLCKKENGSSIAVDRGGYIKHETAFERTAPCMIPFSQMQIEYDGTLLPCCNIHSGLDMHSSYVLGKLTKDSNIFVEWTNQNFVSWRRKLISEGKKEPPCTYCSM